MTDTDEPQYRSIHDPDPEHIEVREDVDDEDGMFEVRMPIASTGEVRNQGDEPLTREELDGMATQVAQRQINVFPNHGTDAKISPDRYSPFERMGYWADAEVEAERSDDGEDLLMATARMPDPETLPAATGQYREALAIIKEQSKRGIAQKSSIGWREDENSPGGNDLMETSLVGIAADSRTSSQDAAVELARAAQAGRPDADPEELVEDVRALVLGPDDDTRTEEDMTDEESTESGDEQSADPDEEQDGMDDQEWRETMLEQQRTQTETLNTLAEAIREDDEDDDDEEEDQEGDDEDDDDDEQSADEPENSQDALEVDGEELTAEDVRDLRDAAQEADVELPANLQAASEEDAGGEEGDQNRDATDDEGDDVLNQIQEV